MSRVTSKGKGAFKNKQPKKGLTLFFFVFCYYGLNVCVFVLNMFFLFLLLWLNFLRLLLFCCFLCFGPALGNWLDDQRLVELVPPCFGDRNGFENAGVFLEFGPGPKHRETRT